jgi:hypothetical protein
MNVTCHFEGRIMVKDFYGENVVQNIDTEKTNFPQNWGDYTPSILKICTLLSNQ